MLVFDWMAHSYAAPLHVCAIPFVIKVTCLLNRACDMCYVHAHLCSPLCDLLAAAQVSSYDDVGGEVADSARDAGLSAMASAHVIVLVLDVAMALKSQKVKRGCV